MVCQTIYSYGKECNTQCWTCLFKKTPLFKESYFLYQSVLMYFVLFTLYSKKLLFKCILQHFPGLRGIKCRPLQNVCWQPKSWIISAPPLHKPEGLSFPRQSASEYDRIIKQRKTYKYLGQDQKKGKSVITILH